MRRPADADDSAIKTLSLAELFAECEERETYERTLHPKHPDHARGFRFDDEHQTVDIWWGGYEYYIHLDRIATPLHLLHWIAHLGEKGWRGQTPRRIRALIEAISKRKGWPLWEPDCVGSTSNEGQ